MANVLLGQKPCPASCHAVAISTLEFYQHAQLDPCTLGLGSRWPSQPGTVYVLQASCPGTKGVRWQHEAQHLVGHEVGGGLASVPQSPVSIRG